MLMIQRLPGILEPRDVGKAQGHSGQFRPEQGHVLHTPLPQMVARVFQAG